MPEVGLYAAHVLSWPTLDGVKDMRPMIYPGRRRQHSHEVVIFVTATSSIIENIPFKLSSLRISLIFV